MGIILKMPFIEGSSSGDLTVVEYPFIVIIPESTLNLSYLTGQYLQGKYLLGKHLLR